MNLFETVKAGVTVPEAATFCGLKMNTKHMTNCPFHPDKSPSMKLNDAYYYCFACGANGDAITLTSKLLHLPPKEAALHLAERYGIHANTPTLGKKRWKSPLRIPFKPDVNKLSETMDAIHRKAEEQKHETRLIHAQQVLTDYLHLLIIMRQQYAPVHQEDEWHPLFIEALSFEERIQHLQEQLDDPVERPLFLKYYGNEADLYEQRTRESALAAADAR